MKKANYNVDIENLQPEVVEEILKIEAILGEELTITSGYRSPDHPIEAAKKVPGEHTKGLAIDVACTIPSRFYDITAAAIEVGCERIGISRKSNFIHLGWDITRPKSIWTY